MLILIWLTLTVAVVLLWYFSQPFYWKKKKIPYLTPIPLFGNLLPAVSLGIIEYFKILNKKFPGHRYYGMHFLTRPTLYIKDPKLIQRILATDFDNFTSHGTYVNQDRDPAGRNLFSIHGQQWKEMRGKLSQHFTPAKVKTMLSCVDNTMEKLTATIDGKIKKEEAVEIKILMRSVATDIITQAIFGVKSDVFENENSIFNELANKMFRNDFTFRLFAGIASPKLYDFFRLTFFEPDFNQLIQDVVKKSIEHRKKENIYVHDFLQGLIELLDTQSSTKAKFFADETRVTNYDMETVISQAIIFHVGGAETPAVTMTFLLYEMALHSEIQEKCREEINSILKTTGCDTLTIQDLPRLTYLNATIQETMRIHSPFKMITRECTKEYKVPDSDLTIEPGTFVLMTPLSTHMEEENFPKPHIFRPERFLDEEKNSIKPGTYFPFSLGPRHCIGMNFAMGEMKLVISRLLQNYEFYICSKTQVPVKYGKYLFLTTPAEELWLGVRPIA